MNSKHKIYVIEPQGPKDYYKVLANDSKLDFVCVDIDTINDCKDEILSSAEGVIITSKFGFDKADLIKADKLKIIAKSGGKPSNVDVDAATQNGIAVTYSPRANSSTVAEFAILSMLVSLRRYDLELSKISQNIWRDSSKAPKKGEIRGKIIGLIGYGDIGSEIGKRLQGFDCSVYVYDPYYRGGTELPNCVTFVSDLNKLIQESDIITVNCALTEETRNLLSSNEFSMMKPNAIVINTARGPIIDEQALVYALHAGQITAAALDVFTVEPLTAKSPLAQEKNAIITPHVACWVAEAMEREVLGAINAVKAYFNQQEIPGLINGNFTTFLNKKVNVLEQKN